MKNINIIGNWFSEKLTQLQVWMVALPKRNWVSYNAEKLIRKSKRKERTKISEVISEKWFTWMDPSRWWASLVLAMIIVILPQPLIGLLFNTGVLSSHFLSFLDSDFLSTIWQVLASIIGISFVIVVFLTEYSQDHRYERRSFPVYASATSMIFIVMVGLLTLMSMGIDLAFLKSDKNIPLWVLGVSFWNSSLFLINLFFVLVLYVRTYQLLNPRYFRKILIAYHRRKVLEHVYVELYKRVKQNISYRFIEGLGIQPSISGYVGLNKIGIRIWENIAEPYMIEDINFDLISLSVKNAKQFSESFQKDQFIFMGIPGNSVSKEFPDIASVDPKLNQRQIILPLKNALRAKPWKSSRLESASEDLLINRDLISAAIISGQADNVETSLNLYIETIKAFLDSLKQLGYRFTPELADTEGGWLNRWDIFDTVYQQYVGLLREALKSNNSEIINEFVSFPKQVMTKAFQYQDHFAFRRFADLYPLIYFLSKQLVSDNRATNKIADRCGLLLAEFVNYQIEIQLSQKDIPQADAKELIAYAEYILSVFSQLAKYQIDNLDLSHYRLTIGSMQRILNGFTSKHDEFKISHLEFQIEQMTDDALKKESIHELQNEETLNSLVSSLQNIRKGAIFGLGTWLCHLVDTGRLSNADFEHFSQPIDQEFGNLSLLNESYNNAISMEDQNKFRWNSWEMDEWDDEAYGEGRFGSINFSSWLSLYYTYKALELTPENPAAILEINPTPNIKGSLDNIKSTIKYFSENKNWEYAIKKLGNIELRSQILERSHEAAYAKQLEIEEIETIQIPISDKKVKEFITDTEKTWKEQGVLRNLFTVYGRYSPRADSIPPRELLPFGIHQRIPKGVFIEDPRISYPMWGESYGRSMAEGENLRISTSFNQLPTIPANLEEFEDMILKQLSLLKTKGLNPIILYGHNLHRQFFESKKYEPHWRTTRTGPKGLRKFDGFYEDIVVMRVPISPNFVVIYDPCEFGELVQY